MNEEPNKVQDIAERSEGIDGKNIMAAEDGSEEISVFLIQ